MLEQSGMVPPIIDPEETENLRAGIYARTSKNAQKHGYSIDEQVAQCLERCERMGWDVAFVFVDEAESGKDTERPKFQEMLKITHSDLIDVVVFWALDRFSRSLQHAVELESELRQRDVALHSLREMIDTTTASGRFNFRSVASAAEFERDMAKQRTRMTLQAIASEHKWPNRDPPLGYNLTSERKLEVNQSEKELVERIFASYLRLRSMPKVADKLNDRGLTTNQGNDWTARAIGDVLQNEIYIGHYKVGNHTDQVPEYQIIDEDTFERATKVRRRFQNDGARESMSDERKSTAINRMLDEYEDYVEYSQLN